MSWRDRPARRTAAPLRRWLIWMHRYVGIPLSPLFVLWFVSGVVMMYTGGMPELMPATRIERRAALDLSRVQLTPAAAAERGGVRQPPAQASLLSVMGRPAYRFDGVTVFADTGERLPPLGPDEAREVARRFTGASAAAITHDRLVVEPDQWMLIAQPFLPAHKLRVADGAGTELYVAQWTAEVAMMTTRRSRALAWMGVNRIVHSVHRYSRLERWLFNGLHSLDFAFWYDRRPLWDIGLIALMMGGLVSSGIGLWLGIARVRRALGR